MLERNSGFDSLKGLLIVLVMLGHVLLGTMAENPWREAIYFFHMPVFLAVSGYFIKRTFVTSSISSIFLRYRDRLIVPFLIAFAAYTLVHLSKQSAAGGIGLSSYVLSVLYPYYHLWYVPAILAFIFYLKIIELSPKYLSYIILSIFLALTVFFESYGKDFSDNVFYKLLGDKRFYYNFSYYYFGYLLALKMPRVRTVPATLGVITGIGMYCLFEPAILVGLGKVVANFCIILIIFSVLNKVNLKGGILADIGKISLPIYLWHVFPIIIIKALGLSVATYYVASFFALFAMTLLLLQLHGRVPLLNRVLYGEP